jgi:FAD:protein FMN transferase
MVLMTDMNNNLQVITDNFRAMGTNVSIEIVSDLRETHTIQAKKIAESIKEAKNIFAKNEKVFSRFLPDSELNKINNSLGHEIETSREMFEVLELCLKFHEISEGYFDPRIIGNLEKIGYDKDFDSYNFNVGDLLDTETESISGRLADDLILNLGKKTVIARRRVDTTGIAKGYTVDEVAEFLKKEGYKNFIVDAGGDMFAQGFNEEGEDWRIGIEGLEDEKIMLKLHNQGIATSGISRKKWTIGDKKFHHLINPKNPPYFSWNLKTVTVIKEKTVEADGRAKVLFLMDREKGLEFANSHNLKALFLDYKNNVYLSEAMKDKVLKI